MGSNALKLDLKSSSKTQTNTFRAVFADAKSGVATRILLLGGNSNCTFRLTGTQ